MEGRSPVPDDCRSGLGEVPNPAVRGGGAARPPSRVAPPGVAARLGRARPVLEPVRRRGAPPVAVPAGPPVALLVVGAGRRGVAALLDAVAVGAGRGDRHRVGRRRPGSPPPGADSRRAAVDACPGGPDGLGGSHRRAGVGGPRPGRAGVERRRTAQPWARPVARAASLDAGRSAAFAAGDVDAARTGLRRRVAGPAPRPPAPYRVCAAQGCAPRACGCGSFGSPSCAGPSGTYGCEWSTCCGRTGSSTGQGYSSSTGPGVRPCPGR